MRLKCRRSALPPVLLKPCLFCIAGGPRLHLQRSGPRGGRRLRSLRHQQQQRSAERRVGRRRARRRGLCVAGGRVAAGVFTGCRFEQLAAWVSSLLVRCAGNVAGPLHTHTEPPWFPRLSKACSVHLAASDPLLTPPATPPPTPQGPLYDRIAHLLPQRLCGGDLAGINCRWRLYRWVCVRACVHRRCRCRHRMWFCPKEPAQSRCVWIHGFGSM